MIDQNVYVLELHLYRPYSWVRRFNVGDTMIGTQVAMSVSTLVTYANDAMPCIS